jgi:hypothetical protein
MVGLLAPFGDALLGQRLSQPGMLVGHGPHLSYRSAACSQRALVVAGWFRMTLGRAARIGHLP